MKEPASFILIVAIAAAVGASIGWAVRVEWDKAIVAATAARTLLHDCNMPCPIPEDKAMHPNNPKPKGRP